MDLRHQVLVMSINPQQKEQNAMETISFLIKFSTAYILIATLMEALFFFLYNGQFHPFSKILDTSTGKLTKCIVSQFDQRGSYTKLLRQS